MQRRLVGSVSSVISLYTSDCMRSLGVHFSLALIQLLSFRQDDRAGQRSVCLNTITAVRGALKYCYIVVYINESLPLTAKLFPFFVCCILCPLTLYKAVFESLFRSLVAKFTVACLHLFILSLCNFSPLFASCALWQGCKLPFWHYLTSDKQVVFMLSPPNILFCLFFYFFIL